MQKLTLKKYFLLFLTVITLIFITSSYAQQLDANRIKAAYMINFIKHISWPNEKNKKHYQVTIYKDKPFFQFLSSSLSNKVIKNKPLQIAFADNLAQLKGSDVVYISKNANNNLHHIANQLRGHQVLLISDSSKEKHDVMINLNHSDDNAVISFEINKSNIVYEQLKMSAELLLLGGTELDVATLYRETEAAMQKTRQQDIDLKTQLLYKQQQLAYQQGQLKQSQKQLTISLKETKLQKIQLEKLKKDVFKKQHLLSAKEEKLQNISALFTETEQKLTQQQQVLEQKEKKNQQMLARVANNKNILLQQDKQLADHQRQLAQQDQELIARNRTINSQQAYLLITTVLVVIAILVSLLVVFFFIKNKKTTRKLTKTLAFLENTQEQLIQAEKMASLGNLVAGVAHEINTPLGIAITSTSLVIDDTNEVKEKIADGRLSKSRMIKHIDKVEDSLSMSEKALNRVKVLLTNFKQVAADQEFDDKRLFDLNEYIDEIMMTLSVEMKKHHISYQFESDANIEITTFPGAFAQILTNLVNNSIRHGFEHKEQGKVTISLQTNKLENADQNWAVKIIYQDDGCGMNSQILKNIFEPFFTTKRGEGSTGLGMNIVYNIINQKMKGDIKITSQEGQGSTFEIFLPAFI